MPKKRWLPSLSANAFLCILLLFSGCDLLPDSEQLMRSGLEVGKQAGKQTRIEDPIAAMERFLPRGAGFVAAPNAFNGQLYFYEDICGDSSREIGFTYELETRPGEVHGMVLQQIGEDWEALLVIDEPIYDFAMVNLVPGSKKELLVGLCNQNSTDKWLRCYWDGDQGFTKFTDITYYGLQYWLPSDDTQPVHLGLRSTNYRSGLSGRTQNLQVIWFDRNAAGTIQMRLSYEGRRALLESWIKGLEAQLRVNPQDVDSAFNLAQDYCEAGRYQEAIDISMGLKAQQYEQLGYDEGEERAFLNVILLNAYAALGDYEAAYNALKEIHSFKEAGFIETTDASERPQSSQLCILPNNRWYVNDALTLTSTAGEVLVAVGRYDAAKALYHRSIGLLEYITSLKQREEAEGGNRGPAENGSANLFLRINDSQLQLEAFSEDLIASWRAALKRIQNY